MLGIIFFKQMLPSLQLIEIAKKSFCCSKFRGWKGGGRVGGGGA